MALGLPAVSLLPAFFAMNARPMAGDLSPDGGAFSAAAGSGRALPTPQAFLLARPARLGYNASDFPPAWSGLLLMVLGRIT